MSDCLGACFTSWLVVSLSQPSYLQPPTFCHLFDSLTCSPVTYGPQLPVASHYQPFTFTPLALRLYHVLPVVTFCLVYYLLPPKFSPVFCLIVYLSPALTWLPIRTSLPIKEATCPNRCTWISTLTYYPLDYIPISAYSSFGSPII